MERERATIKARPKLASMALKESRIKVRKVLACVTGLRIKTRVKIASRARASRVSRAGSRRVRWIRNVSRAIKITNG